MSNRDDAGRYQVFATTGGPGSPGAPNGSSSKTPKRRQKAGAAGGGRDTVGDFSGDSYIYRYKLVDGLVSSLERDGLVVLCGEYGLGRHVTARQLASTLRGRGAITTELRVSGLCSETICRKVRLALKEASVFAKEGGYALVVIDGLGILDDCVLARLSRSISNGVLSGCKIVVLLDPDCESMLEFLPSCHVVRASELLLDASEYSAWEGLLGGFSVVDAKRCTHGIASLLAVLRAVRCLPDGTPHGSAWDRVVGELLSHALRPELIEEELAIRCGMAALGYGDVQELERLGIRVSYDILREISSSAPIFGVDLQAGCFELVPCEADIVATSLAALPPKFEEVLSSAIRELAAQGRIRRASAIASALANGSNLRMLATEFPLEMIDAGQSRLLMRVVFSDEGAADLMPARRILRGLGISHLVTVGPGADGAAPSSSDEPGLSPRPSARVSMHVRLADAMREVKRTGSYPIGRQEEACVATVGGVTAAKLLARGREMELRLQGRSVEAFRELLVARELREQHGEPSVFSAMLASDFESLRILVGDPEASGDQMRLTKAREVLERCAPVSMRSEAQSLLSLTSAVTGASGSLHSVERFASAQEQADQVSLMAWVNLVTGIANLGSGAYRNAYVRACTAFASARKCGFADVALAAAMVERAALAGLGENPALASLGKGTTLTVPNRNSVLHGLGGEGLLSGDGIGMEAGGDVALGPAEVAEEEEPSVDLALLNQLYGAVLEDDLDARAGAIAAMQGLVPRVEVMTFAACLARSDRSCGSRLADALPLSWRPRQALPQMLQDEIPVDGRWLDEGSALQQFVSRDDIPLLEVCVMGGFAVRRGGVRISEREWRRRRSRDLISMLALTPGHMLARRDAMNQLWQDVDPIRGRESLYSVLSSLRSTIGQNLPELKYVVGEQGKIWLDEALVVCDVDEFERVARQVMGRKIPDDEAVSLCLRMEGMYGSGSYLPTNDVDGRYRRRHEELSRRFVDAMLTGADAARRLRDERQAQWFLETARVEKGNCPKIALA